MRGRRPAETASGPGGGMAVPDGLPAALFSPPASPATPRKFYRKRRKDTRRNDQKADSVPALSTFASPRSPSKAKVQLHSASLTRNAGASADLTASQPGLIPQPVTPARGPRYVHYDSSSSGMINLASSVEAMGVSGTPPFPRREAGDALPLSPAATPRHEVPGSPRSPRPAPSLQRQDSGSASEAGTSSYAASASLRSGHSHSHSRSAAPAKPFLIAKELLHTERTYLRDLRLLSRDLRGAVEGTDADRALEELFGAVLPLVEFHGQLAGEVEGRLGSWAEEPRIGDVLLAAVHNSLPFYQAYLLALPRLLRDVDELFRGSPAFAALYRELESRKAFYVPLSTLVLRPTHRLLAYQALLTRLVSHYAESGASAAAEASECRVALDKLSPLLQSHATSLQAAENFIKLSELERDLLGVKTLVQPNRRFLREGSLSRLSRKGPVQRLFLLFSDCLLYASRAAGAQLAFRLHGQIPLRGLMLEDGEPFRGSSGLAHCFTLYGGSRSLILGASSAQEKELWMRELREAAEAAKDSSEDLAPFASLNAHSSNEELNSSLERSPSREGPADDSRPGRPSHSLHVCWHRSTSLGREQALRAGRAGLSGFLLRKFRNSSGWQKLWVVYAAFSLFFFKGPEEKEPLASLPLLGYSVSVAGPEEGVAKEHVFKLHYKSHFYFFRADSQYAFRRWLEVIRAATGSTD